MCFDGTQSTNTLKLRGYLDGNQVSLTFEGTIPNALSNTTYTGYRIGQTFTSPNQYGSSNISQVQIYNRALSAQEVSQNFNALRGRYGI